MEGSTTSPLLSPAGIDTGGSNGTPHSVITADFGVWTDGAGGSVCIGGFHVDVHMICIVDWVAWEFDVLHTIVLGVVLSLFSDAFDI